MEPKPTTKAHAPWVVNLPPLLSGTAKRERRYFDTKKAAETFCTQQRIRLENYGTASTTLPAGKIEQAAAAFEKLNGTGVGLLDRQGEIVAVASRVAGLQVVTIHRQDRTIRQVAEGAADGISARVTDQSQS